jgi:glycosyltransferase involved in cell wall biosynthesis
MFATISIPTYNRPDTLAATLESLRELRCPKGVDYEILIVDNNSNDHTPDVIKKYAELLLPRLRGVFEPKQGLSHARNRALQEAQGEIVCFLDDDVIVDPGWLSAVAEAFDKYSAAVVGGRTYLIYPCQRPSWLSEKREIFLSHLNYGDEVIVNIDKDLFGLNFSVNRDMAIQVGGFDLSLGRCGKSLSSGEESDLLRRIRAKGGIAVYEPKAVVGHIVPPERLKKSWFLKRVFDGAVCSERLSIANGKRPRVLKPAVHALRCLCSIFKSFAQGDFSTKTLFSRSLYASSALGVLSVNIRLSLNSLGRKYYAASQRNHTAL